jgi:hypothetical protein
VPGSIVLLVELFLDERCYVFLDVVPLKSLKNAQIVQQFRCVRQLTVRCRNRTQEFS